MKKATAALWAGLLIFMAGCGNNTHSPLDIVERDQLIGTQSESVASEEDTGSPAPTSPAESKPEGSAEKPKPAEKPESTPAKPKPAEKPPAEGKPQYSLSSNTVKAGDYITINVKNCGDDMTALFARIDGLGTNPAFFPTDEGAMAFFAVSRNTDLGSYTLNLGGAPSVTLKIVDAGFERQEFYMDTSVTNSTVNSSAASDEYNRITKSVMAPKTADPHLPSLDDFILPITQSAFKISSSYGYTRVVNGKVSGRHEGVDFPAPRGTPVVAANSGRVLFAGFMAMTGNTVVIEHGMGLKSWYQHMDSLSCKTGDELSAGAPVGKVGTTGYSTGNHLHFGISINDVYTNPWQFIPKP